MKPEVEPLHPCPELGCPFRGSVCPDHELSYPDGFNSLDRGIRQRPGDSWRGGGRQLQILVDGKWIDTANAKAYAELSPTSRGSTVTDPAVIDPSTQELSSSASTAAGEDDDPAYRLAADIFNNPNRYRMLESMRCPEHKAVTATIYATTGGRLVLWTVGTRSPVNPHVPGGPVKAVRTPPRAIDLPGQVGDLTEPQVAICPRCRKGRLLLPRIGGVDDVGRLEPATFIELSS